MRARIGAAENMIIARVDDDVVAPPSVARGSACELFERIERPGYLALLEAAPADWPGWTLTPIERLFTGGRFGPDAGSWLFAVGLRVPHEHRDEFLSWYAEEHLPILLECSTWEGCRFVEAPDPSACRFIALHQLADRAALSSPERARSRATPWFMRLARHDWFDGPFTRNLYRRVGNAA